ncbi:MAG: putative addiction module antidote protein [Spirochaetaceae bacterium]|jgi:probable addiction module antidote protein|nr:putative addiction module antidote protein [Spirochaetaceae bacterium]
MNEEKITFTEWNLEGQIVTKEDVIGALEAVFELAIQENDLEFLLKAIGGIARSNGMAQIASELTLDRASLYKSLSPSGNPSFFTVVKVLDNLGFKLSIQQKQAS